ncbi:MAG TPA: HAD hydrolase-like protein [Thermoleophilaceae bacterium]|nr:HAD hydrolase-like protein [Thermoleophilaceae bacterium]
MLLVLWDVDGTLVDSAEHGRRAFEDAYREAVGRPLESSVDYAGRTDHQIAMAMLEGIDGADEHLPRLLEELVPALEARQELIRREGRVYPGVRETLEALGGRGDVRQSLLTGNLEANAAIKIGAFALERHFDFELGAYGSDPHERRSDLVAIARERAEAKLGQRVEPVLVGDTPRDVQAAREAGVPVVAVATGFSAEEALRQAQPDALLRDLSNTGRAIEAITSA